MEFSRESLGSTLRDLGKALLERAPVHALSFLLLALLWPLYLPLSLLGGVLLLLISAAYLPFYYWNRLQKNPWRRLMLVLLFPIWLPLILLGLVIYALVLGGIVTWEACRGNNTFDKHCGFANDPDSIRAIHGPLNLMLMVFQKFGAMLRFFVLFSRELLRGIGLMLLALVKGLGIVVLSMRSQTKSWLFVAAHTTLTVVGVLLMLEALASLQVIGVPTVLLPPMMIWLVVAMATVFLLQGVASLMLARPPKASKSPILTAWKRLAAHILLPSFAGMACAAWVTPLALPVLTTVAWVGALSASTWLLMRMISVRWRGASSRAPWLPTLQSLVSLPLEPIRGVSFERGLEQLDHQALWGFEPWHKVKVKASRTSPWAGALREPDTGGQRPADYDSRQFMVL